MQIVIDIPEEIYNMSRIAIVHPLAETNIPLAVICKGIPLSKGHGRIADMDAAIKCIKDCEGDDAIWAISLIDWACGKRTIIEADKGSEDKE